MKVIKIPPSIIHLEDFGNAGKQKLSTQMLRQKLEPFYENQKLILAAALHLEFYFDMIISNYFFSDTKDSNTPKHNFNNYILSSSWCTFSSKKQILLRIMSEVDLLKGKDKNKYEEILSKVMGYRNAFTHGTISTDGETFKLSYFAGLPKTDLLTDEYLSKVENTINDCFEMTRNIVWPTTK